MKGLVNQPISMNSSVSNLNYTPQVNRIFNERSQEGIGSQKRDKMNIMSEG